MFHSAQHKMRNKKRVILYFPITFILLCFPGKLFLNITEIISCYQSHHQHYFMQSPVIKVLPIILTNFRYEHSWGEKCPSCTL